MSKVDAKELLLYAHTQLDALSFGGGLSSIDCVDMLLLQCIPAAGAVLLEALQTGACHVFAPQHLMMGKDRLLKIQFSWLLYTLLHFHLGKVVCVLTRFY